MCVCACVCVCVCAGECVFACVCGWVRERERAFVFVGLSELCDA